MLLRLVFNLVALECLGTPQRSDQAKDVIFGQKRVPLQHKAIDESLINT